MKEIKEKLRKAGYAPIEVYEAQPEEEDPEHSHAFDTYISVFKGKMFVRRAGEELTLYPGDEMYIPKGELHYSKVGSEGCSFLHAERHDV